MDGFGDGEAQSRRLAQEVRQDDKAACKEEDGETAGGQAD